MKNPSSQNPVVFVIVNRLFEWSQNFITRELVELKRQGVELVVGAREMIRRDDLDAESATLKNRFIEIPENPFLPGHLLRHFRFKRQYSERYNHAWQHFRGFRHDNFSAKFRGFVCLFRAASIAQQVIDEKIDLIHAHFLTAPGETALYLSALTQIPFGGTGHAMDIYVDNSGLAKKVREAAYIATCTAANAAHLKTQYPENSDKIFTIYHGIDVAENIENTPRGSQPFTFLSAGRFVEKKGFKYLIDACKIVKNRGIHFRCRIVGKGPLADALQNQIRENQLADTVRIDDYIPPNEMKNVYQGSDALVVPSIIDQNGDRDGLPNVCLEAMANGLPIIGSAISGIPEGIVDGRSGFIVPPGDAAKLAVAMINLIHHKKLGEMRKASHALARDKFDIKKNVARLKAIMEKHVE